MLGKKTAIVTGAQQGINAGLAGGFRGFLNDSYKVVATSLRAGESLLPSPRLILIDGDIRNRETTEKTVDAEIRKPK